MKTVFPGSQTTAGRKRSLDEQPKTNWPQELGAIAHQLNPLHEQIFAGFPAEYYWSVVESEWATDVGFGGGMELERLHCWWSTA